MSFRTLVALCPWSVVVLLSVPDAGAQTPSIPAVVETAPVPSSGDAADDMAMWVHPTDPGLSRVIGTDKDSGLLLYDLAGTQLQYLPHGELNNVDIRYGFPLTNDLQVALVTSAERTQDRLAIYMIDPDTHLLVNVTAGVISLGFDVYGCCMYKSPVTGDYYAFINSEDGHFEQWRLIPTGTGTVTATQVRAFDLSSVGEGCAADDETALLFIAEENVGLWRYGAEPGDGTVGVLLDTVGGGHLTADAEGVAIYYTTGGAGHLLVSSQGNNTFAVYDRAPPHAWQASFQVGANVALGIDAVTESDGIDVVNLALGSAFPTGVFLAQDGANTGGNQNFKLVPWGDIAAATTPPLIVDTTYDAFGAFGDPWVDVGGGTTGVNGPPTLTGEGPLIGDTPVALHLTQAPASVPMLLWISLENQPVSAVGGTIHAYVPVLEYLLFTDPAGGLTAATIWPTGVPSGVEMWFQYLILDTSTLYGITLSNCVKGTTP